MKPENVSTINWLKYNTLFFTEHLLGPNLYQRVFSNTEKKLLGDIEKEAVPNKPESTFKVVEYKNGEWPTPLHHPYEVRVFRGAAKDWECTKKWSFEYFADQFGDKEVTLLGNEGLVEKGRQDWETLTLREYIKQLLAGSKRYLKFSEMISEDSSLWNDFNGEWLRQFKQSDLRNHFFMFMGAKGTMTPIHNGLPPTVFVQVLGEKKWILFPTSDRMFLGVRPERRLYFYSHADPHDKSNPKFPLLKLATPIEVTIGPGDVLWFPSLVWHQVENLSDSLGVAYKFTHFPSAFKSSKMLSSLFFLSTKPTLFESVFKGWTTNRIYMFVKPKK